MRMFFLLWSMDYMLNDWVQELQTAQNRDGRVQTVDVHPFLRAFESRPNVRIYEDCEGILYSPKRKDDEYPLFIVGKKMDTSCPVMKKIPSTNDDGL